jgi:enoyl-CoA hydratase
MTTTSCTVRYTVDAAVAVLTLDRPEVHNALTVKMLRELAEASRAAQRDNTVRAIVLTGAGERTFCAGGDLAELIPQLTAGELEVLTPDPTKRLFSDVDKPVIAAVNGLCLAGGLELLLGTDLRIAAESAIFGLPEVRWGIIPGAGSHIRLPQQVPWAFAMQLLLTGDHVSAQRAHQVGLINQVLPGSQNVLPQAMELAQRLCRNGPLAMRAAKRIAVQALGNESRYALEHAINQYVVASADAREGPRTFAQKRSPRFTGS